MTTPQGATAEQIRVTEQSDSPANVSEAVRQFVGGAIRKKLGLESSDLRLGLDLARNQMQRGATAEAFRTCAALVLCDPSDPELQIGLANCAVQIGEDELALQAASVVVALAPSDPRGYYLSGRACLGLGHYADAKEDLTAAMKFAKASRNTVVFEEADKLMNKLAALSS
jgi:Flp pilus assembly protein TadD